MNTKLRKIRSFNPHKQFNTDFPFKTWLKLRNFGSLPMKYPGTKLQAVIMLISEFLGDFTNFVGFVNTT